MVHAIARPIHHYALISVIHSAADFRALVERAIRTRSSLRRLPQGFVKRKKSTGHVGGMNTVFS